MRPVDMFSSIPNRFASNTLNSNNNNSGNAIVNMAQPFKM